MKCDTAVNIIETLESSLFRHVSKPLSFSGKLTRTLSASNLAQYSKIETHNFWQTRLWCGFYVTWEVTVAEDVVVSAVEMWRRLTSDVCLATFKIVTQCASKCCIFICLTTNSHGNVTVASSCSHIMAKHLYSWMHAETPRLICVDVAERYSSWPLLSLINFNLNAFCLPVACRNRVRAVRMFFCDACVISNRAHFSCCVFVWKLTPLRCLGFHIFSQKSRLWAEWRRSFSPLHEAACCNYIGFARICDWVMFTCTRTWAVFTPIRNWIMFTCTRT